MVTYMTSVLASTQWRGASGDSWTIGLSKELLLFTHRQWTHRNTITHYTPAEGKTVAEHGMVDDHVRSLMQLSISDLPPQHRHLLTSENFKLLGASSTTKKQLWIADITPALEEAALWKHLHNSNTQPKQKVIKLKQQGKTYAVSSINSLLFPPNHSRPHQRSNRNRPNN